MSRSIPPHRGDPRAGRRSYHDAGAGYIVSTLGLSKAPRWSRLALLAILVFDVWLRGHTFGPTVRDRLGWAPWPVVVGEAEPLDCDEAVYAYMGRRDAPRRRPVSRPERAQAPRRILALHPGRRARRGHGDDDPGHADPPGARHHRPHLVARAPAPGTRGRVPGGPDLRGRQHRPVSLRQWRATSSMRSTCSRWRHWP